jgi:acetyltransferase-like isoleucine patch superfamily enzyme
VGKVTVSPNSFVDETATLGEGTRVWNFVHIRENVKIGKECVVADYVYVGKDVKIGNYVKLENRVTVYEGVTIEDKVFVGPHVSFTNDLYPRSFSRDWKIIRTLIKEGASIGAGAILICGVNIGEYAFIGAGSVVTENVPPHALVYGNPASIRGFVCRCGRKLETEKKNKKYVLTKCQFCKKQYRIAFKDYAKMKVIE